MRKRRRRRRRFSSSNGKEEEEEAEDEEEEEAEAQQEEEEEEEEQGLGSIMLNTTSPGRSCAPRVGSVLNKRQVVLNWVGSVLNKRRATPSAAIKIPISASCVTVRISEPSYNVSPCMNWNISRGKDVPGHIVDVDCTT